MTNGDKIRAMSNLELAAFLLDQPYNNSACHVCPHKDVRCFDIEDACVDGIEAWLNGEEEQTLD